MDRSGSSGFRWRRFESDSYAGQDPVNRFDPKGGTYSTAEFAQSLAINTAISAAIEGINAWVVDDRDLQGVLGATGMGAAKGFVGALITGAFMRNSSGSGAEAIFYGALGQFISSVGFDVLLPVILSSPSEGSSAAVYQTSAGGMCKAGVVAGAMGAANETVVSSLQSAHWAIRLWAVVSTALGSSTVERMCEGGVDKLFDDQPKVKK